MSQHPSDPGFDAALVGHAPDGVGAALSGLDGLDGLDALPVTEHVERFEAVHDALRARLAGEPGTPRSDGGPT